MTSYNTNRRYLTNSQTRALVQGEAMNETGDETIGGVKTFTSSPIIPAPTTDMQAATKKYVDDNGGASDRVANGTIEARVTDTGSVYAGGVVIENTADPNEVMGINFPSQFWIYGNAGADGSGNWDKGIDFQSNNANILTPAGGKITHNSEPLGADGSFTSQDNKTVTVVNGLITSIV